MATRVTSENLSRGTERMGVAERKGTSYLADAANPEALHSVWKEARVAIAHQAEVEKGVVRSSSVLYADPAAAPSRLAAMQISIDKNAAALTESARTAYALAAQRLNTQPVYEPVQTAEEREASNLIVECASGNATYSGCGAGGRGGGGGAVGGGRGQARGNGITSLPQHMNAELTILLGKHKSVLEIRDFLSGEFEPVPLADVMAALRAREAIGLIKLAPRVTSVPSRR
jgi:hypothetical protein